LPCLSIGAPVIYINTEGLRGGRFEGLLDLLRVFELQGTTFQTMDAVLSKAGKINLNTKIDNKHEYTLIKEKLEHE
jgi:hypothetical protein